MGDPKKFIYIIFGTFTFKRSLRQRELKNLFIFAAQCDGVGKKLRDLEYSISRLKISFFFLLCCVSMDTDVTDAQMNNGLFRQSF